MEDKRNAYEIVGTNKVAIDRKKDELEKDDFIKEKALETIKRISRKIEIEKQKLEATSSLSEKILINREIEKLEKEIENIQKAYERIFDKEHREKYNAFLEIVDKSKETMLYRNSSKSQENEEKNLLDEVPDEVLVEIKNRIGKNKPKKKNAYEILKISKGRCDDRTRKSENIDEFLLQRKEGLIEFAKVEYEKKVNADKKNEFAAKQKLKLEVRTIEGAYREIATKEKREIYNQKLADIERKEQKAIEDEIFKIKYDRSGNYEPSSIVTLKYQDFTKENDRSKLPAIIISRENGQEILIQKVGRIGYEDSFGVKDEIGEYEITRIIKGEETTDKVYIPGLNILELGVDEKTGVFQNEAYYKFIANEMLSEEAIRECSKYNNGYLGEPLKDNNGNYFRYLDGREELSAVMKFYEERDKEQGKHETEQENQLKNEGDERE